MIFINDQNNLENFCREIRFQPIIGVDTEFYRRTTYFAKLSIIQIVTLKHKVIIDALANIDLTSIKEIFFNQEILKIFHSPREDFEIIFQLFKQLPQNIFDTQIAASICGFGQSLSYRDLCEKICGVRIDKTHQKANWIKRPISFEMLDYAIKDVEYLPLLYNKLQNMIINLNTNDIYQKKINNLMNIKNYTINISNAWQKVKFQNHSTNFIKRMQVIAAFREESASFIDVPRKHFATDEDLIRLCKYLPSNDRALKELNLRSRHLGKTKFKTQLFDLCAGLSEK